MATDLCEPPAFAGPDCTNPDIARIPLQFGRYRVETVIGVGSTGCVYRARDPLAERHVAVKVLHPSPWIALQAGDCRRRFHHEAEAAGGLSHPNIVAIFDIAPDFFVMEFLPGQTLQSLLAEVGPPEFEQMPGILQPIADALDHAHRKGIVHCDVRPANIMILPDGRPKLMGFGVAHVDDVAATSVGSWLEHSAYAAPEQASGVVGPASDVYALAVIAHEMLTGRKPTRELATWVPAIDLPSHTRSVLARALAHDPESRWESATSLIAALRLPAAAGCQPRRRTVGAPPTSGPVETLDLHAIRGGRLRSRHALVSLGAAVALSVPGVGAVSRRPSVSPPRPRVVLGRLELRTEPPGAWIWIDGRPIGRTPVTADVRQGEHRLRVAEAGFVPVELALPISGQHEPIQVTLQPRLMPRRRTKSPRQSTRGTPHRREPPTVPADPVTTAPRRIAGDAPQFPWDALDADGSGAVMVTLTVAEDGTPQDVRVVESSAPALTQAVLRASRTWRFEPARRAGVAVRSPWSVVYRTVSGR